MRNRTIDEKDITEAMKELKNYMGSGKKPDSFIRQEMIINMIKSTDIGFNRLSQYCGVSSSALFAVSTSNNLRTPTLIIPSAESLNINSIAASEMPNTTMRRLASIKKTVDVLQKGKGRTDYSVELKKEIIQLHYDSSLNFTEISKYTGIPNSIIGKWKRRFGQEKTHIVHGSTTRNDIRTKCLAVREYVEMNISKEHLAEKYYVGKPTITAWINRFENEYNQWIDAPDGISVVAKPERLIYGDANIHQVREFMMLQNDELRDMVHNMQKYGIMANAVAQANKRCVENQDDIDALNKAEEILKKQTKENK